MNKILSVLLLLLGSMNLIAADMWLQKRGSYSEFVSEISEFDTETLLEILLECPLTNNLIEPVLVAKISPDLEDKNGETAKIKGFISKKQTTEIIQYYKSHYVSDDEKFDTNANKKTIYKALIVDIFDRVLSYQKSAIEALYKASNPKKSDDLKEVLERENNLEEEFKFGTNILVNRLIYNTITSRMNSANVFEGHLDHIINLKLQELNDPAPLNEQTRAKIAKLAFNDWVVQQLKTLTPTGNDELVYKKISIRALIALYAVARAHRNANGDGSRFVSDISHNKLIIEQINEHKKLLTNVHFLNILAFPIADIARPFEGDQSKGTVIPAVYKFIVRKPTLNDGTGICNVLVGQNIDIMLDPETTRLLEIKLRDFWDKNTTDESIDRLGTLTDIKLTNNSPSFEASQDGQPVRLYRYLYFFANRMEMPEHWSSAQTNLFCSKFVTEATKDLFPSSRKDFNLTFAPCYAKRMQHVPNIWKFQNLNAKFKETLLLYLGTDTLAPRTIVLGDYNEFYDIQKNNSTVLSNNFFDDILKPYKCRNNQNNSDIKKEQMLICFIAFDNLIQVSEEELSCKHNTDKCTIKPNQLRSNCVYYTKSKNESDRFIVLNPRQIYPNILIEYDGDIRKKSINETRY